MFNHFWEYQDPHPPPRKDFRFDINCEWSLRARASWKRCPAWTEKGIISRNLVQFFPSGAIFSPAHFSNSMLFSSGVQSVFLNMSSHENLRSYHLGCVSTIGPRSRVNSSRLDHAYVFEYIIQCQTTTKRSVRRFLFPFSSQLECKIKRMFGESSGRSAHNLGTSSNFWMHTFVQSVWNHMTSFWDWNHMASFLDQKSNVRGKTFIFCAQLSYQLRTSHSCRPLFRCFFVFSFKNIWNHIARWGD